MPEHGARAGLPRRRVRPLTEDAYVELAVDALTELRPDIIIHRVVADPAPGELVAPDWATRKGDLVRSSSTPIIGDVEGHEKLGGEGNFWRKFLLPTHPPLQRLYVYRIPVPSVP
ncbi:MAG: hypothetical protein ACLRWP_06540 [Bilophila wadsworthia]